jgi:drug/metabolite transporter (DMT)-like permease
MRVVLAMLALALVCSSLGYILYFRLIADIGAAGALTVTYLIPIFGVVWGRLFLGETLSGAMIIGALIVIGGTVLVLRG